MKHNVLVFPCGSEVGLEIHKSLQFSTHFNVLGGSSVEDHGRFVYQHYIGDMPLVDDPDFVDSLNDIIASHRIDFIMPAHDSVVLKLAEAIEQQTITCQVVTSPLLTCQIARSKSATYRRLENSIATPRIYDNPADIIDYPVFMKPDVGQGSKGVYRADSAQDVAFYLKKDPTLLALEYLPGPEYTIDCFTDSEGQLLFCDGRERQRIANGISVKSATVHNDQFKDIARRINKELSFRGAWFFQLKKNANGEPVLLEIAPRIAGTMGLVRCKGVNLPLLSLFDRLGYPVSVFENAYPLTIDRALENRYSHTIHYKHVYLDFDDLVLFEEKVNPVVMAFVFQCLNKSIKIHLLTKHRDDLTKTLKKYRLADIFDELVWIKDTDSKAKYITETEAIFIDDSYTERKQVLEACNIPVFDSHMIESLMEIM